MRHKLIAVGDEGVLELSENVFFADTQNNFSSEEEEMLLRSWTLEKLKLSARIQQMRLCYCIVKT